MIYDPKKSISIEISYFGNPFTEDEIAIAIRKYDKEKKDFVMHSIINKKAHFKRNFAKMIKDIEKEVNEAVLAEDS